MIDTHCHLLAGVDDGPSNDLEAAQLARQLARDGVSYVLCTPHFSRVYPTSIERAGEAFAQLERTLAALKISLEVGLAAEVSAYLLGAMPAEEVLARAVGGRYVIVELDREMPARYVAETLLRLTELRLAPIFAHPERCRAIRGEETLIADARADGAVFQVVMPSLGGRWGEDVASAAWALLERGYADVLATDAHRPSLTHRTVGNVRMRVAETYGDDTLTELTERTPQRLLAGATAGAAATGGPPA